MSRRQSREAAMQILFQNDFGGIEIEEAIRHTVNESGFSNSVQEFICHLVKGTIKNQDYIDKIIAELSKGWHIDRIANVDKAIIRMAIYEILFEENIPPRVSVNEAIELAKVFGGEDSAKFINGIVGKVVENPGAFKEFEKIKDAEDISIELQ